MIYKMSGSSRLAQSLLVFELLSFLLHIIVCTCKNKPAVISTTLNLCLVKRLKTLLLLAPIKYRIWYCCDKLYSESHSNIRLILL